MVQENVERYIGSNGAQTERPGRNGYTLQRSVLMKDFMDDYHAYMSCCSEEETDSQSSGSGCSPGCLTWILAALSLLWIINALFG